MAERLVGWRRNNCDAALLQCLCACVNFLRRDSEGELRA
jgi:hypothetical protein